MRPAIVQMHRGSCRDFRFTLTAAARRDPVTECGGQAGGVTWHGRVTGQWFYRRWQPPLGIRVVGCGIRHRSFGGGGAAVAPPQPWVVPKKLRRGGSSGAASATGGAEGAELPRRGEAEAGAGHAVDDGDEEPHAVTMEPRRSEA
jgi:hypothetical protein